MHPRSLVLVALLCAAASQAGARTDAAQVASTPCAATLAPPAPPAPPAAPAAPRHPGAKLALAPLPPLPAVPGVPAIPSPPLPPPSPALPEVPAEAHAACAGKEAGSKIKLRLGPKETMGGVCERAGGKMAFHMRSYRFDD